MVVPSIPNSVGVKTPEVGDVKERALIEAVRAMQPPLPSGWIGIGDDAAWIKGEPGWTISQDMLVEGVHFRREWAEPRQIGRKAGEVNLSDLAAMGAEPRAALTSVAVPKAVSTAWVTAMYRGLADSLSAYGVPVIGGDTVASPEGIIVDVVVLGTTNQPVLRSGAQLGDYLAVTGTVGLSRLGLELLRSGLSLSSCGADEREAVTAHLEPRAQVHFGRQAAARVHAMTDVSDALADEIIDLTGRSGLGADIWLEQLPLADAGRVVAQRWDKPAEAWALWGAEDYELVMAIAPEHLDEMMRLGGQARGGLHIIGRVTQGAGLRLYRDGRQETLSEEGIAFDHFAP